MSDAHHAPEPWSVYEGEEFDGIIDSHGQHIAEMWMREDWPYGANARRIVACVNALQGVKTEALEDAVKHGIIDVSTGNLFSSRLKLQKERDAALAMARELNEALKSIRSHVYGWPEWNTDAMDVIITKAEAFHG